jgi:hypothetical protein
MDCSGNRRSLRQAIKILPTRRCAAAAEDDLAVACGVLMFFIAQINHKLDYVSAWKGGLQFLREFLTFCRSRAI